jgi:hypothetical protein
MTSTVTLATFLALNAATYDAITKTVGLVSIVILLVLLLLKEVVRVHPAPRLTAWIRAFDLALVPLLITFSIIVTARLAELLQA